MNILVTGAAGFIGSHIVDRLLIDGHNVLGVDNLSNGTMDNLLLAQQHRNFQFAKLNVLEMADDRYPHPVDVIIHLAAMGSVPRSMEKPTLYMQNNVMGFHSVLEFARKNFVKKVFYASSSSVYGNTQKFYRNETDRVEPCSPYAGTKAMNETMAEVYEKAFWIKCHGLRFFNVYGPRQRFDSAYAAMVPKFCKSILEAGCVAINGDGTQVRTFTPVEFVAEAVIDLVVANDFEDRVINITHQNYAASVNDTARLIGRLLGLPYRVDINPERSGDVKSSLGKGDVLEKFLGENLADAFPTVESMLNTCEWYKKLLAAK